MSEKQSTISSQKKSAVILTALAEETRAVLRHLGAFSNETVSGTVFFRGKFEGWDIAVAEVGSGNATAAATAARAIDHYKPSMALFVGVAGGVKDVKVGDVVVATKVYGYEAGKDTASGFKTRPDVIRTTHDLEQRARALRQREDWKQRLDPQIHHEAPTVFVGPIAAGEKVVASRRSSTAKLIREHYGDALAVEMEGRGFLEGVHINHPVQGCVVRGISDLLSGKAQADKAGSQPRAADAASAVAFEILVGLDDSPASKPLPTFIETPTTFCRGAYFKKGEVLATIGVRGEDEVSFSFDNQPDAFLRIIPTRRRDRPIPLSSLGTRGTPTLLKLKGFGGFSSFNDHGVVFYRPDKSYRGGPAPLHCATQLFQNGELWCVSDRMVLRERAGLPHWVPLPFIPGTAFERTFYNALHENIAYAVETLDLTFPCHVELGLAGIANAHMGIANDDIRRFVQSSDVIVRRELAANDASSINAILLEFFNEVHDRTGYTRGIGLFGFPPNPPSSQ